MSVALVVCVIGVVVLPNVSYTPHPRRMCPLTQIHIKQEKKMENRFIVVSMARVGLMAMANWFEMLLSSLVLLSSAHLVTKTNKEITQKRQTQVLYRCQYPEDGEWVGVVR